MSSSLVALIGGIYLLAAGACVLEAKYAWALLNLFWGGGNLVISYLMWAK